MNDKFVLPQGIRVGHAHDDYTGVTCIIADKAIGGVSVRGGAPGTRETDMLRAEKSQGHTDAIVLSGGSAYGLEASCGVSDYLREKGIGFNVGGGKIVPLVAQAILFDLNDPKEYHYPDKAMGYKAAQNAKTEVVFGSVGAGRGATVGKFLGPQNCCKSGIGGATLCFGDVFVSAIVAVNALGDVVDHNTGKILAGAKLNGEFFGVAKALTDGRFEQIMRMQMQARAHTNTTIGCVMTNAALDKTEVNKLAAVSHDGLAMSIRPVHTDMDGDTMFALSKGDKKAEMSVLMALAAEVTALAIENAVKAE